MSKDHFNLHSYMDGKTDWNFNIIFEDIPEIRNVAENYSKVILDSPGLYRPVPIKWLHMTILRLGFIEDFTDKEIESIVSIVNLGLVNLNMPNLQIKPAIVYLGYPILMVDPEEPLDGIFQIIISALRSVAGEHWLPNLVDRSTTKLTPHITLAYTRDYSGRSDLQERLNNIKVPPMFIRPVNLSLVQQRQFRHYYRWNVIQKFSISSRLIS